MFSRKRDNSTPLLDTPEHSAGTSKPPQEKRSKSEKKKEKKEQKEKNPPTPLDLSPEAVKERFKDRNPVYVKISPERTPSPSTASTNLSSKTSPTVLSPLPQDPGSAFKMKEMCSVLKDDEMSGTSSSSSPLHVIRLSTDSSLGASGSPTPNTEKSLLWDSPQGSPKKASPKKSSESPKDVKQSPKKSTGSPKKVSGSPKRASPSPKKTSLSPKRFLSLKKDSKSPKK